MTTKAVQTKLIHSKSSLDDFLESEGLREEMGAIAVKRVLARQLSEAMKEQQKTKQAMARELQTSRFQLSLDLALLQSSMAFLSTADLIRMLLLASPPRGGSCSRFCTAIS
jgi:hypothetical protein